MNNESTLVLQWKINNIAMNDPVEYHFFFWYFTYIIFCAKVLKCTNGQEKNNEIIVVSSTYFSNSGRRFSCLSQIWSPGFSFVRWNLEITKCYWKRMGNFEKSRKNVYHYSLTPNCHSNFLPLCQVWTNWKMVFLRYALFKNKEIFPISQLFLDI